MQVQFFEPGSTPEWVTTPWYEQRERAPHLEQAGHRGRLELAATFVRYAIAEYGVESLSDMGAGDGGLLSLVQGEVGAWGYDLMPANVEAAQRERGVNVSRADILKDDVVYGELAVFTEVLEHLIDPHKVVAECPSRLVVASCPDNETEASHYEFHTWGFDMAGFRAMFEQGGYEVVRHESIGFQVLLGVRR
jgi:hypothetical protein